MEWVDSIWCDPGQRESSRNLCDSNLQNFFALLSILELFLRSSFLKKIVSKVFHYVLTFTFHFVMPLWAPVANIWSPSDQFEDVTVVFSVRL